VSRVRAAASGTDELTARDAGEEPPPRARSPVGDRWAVLVGISDYADDRLTLRYAHRDAQELYDFLLTPAGGAFSPEHISLLLDRDATKDGLAKAFRSFLAQSKEDDLVLIYIACHGAPDAAAARQPLYILTHETDLDDIAGTALPMHEIEWSLRNYVLASRVVILADTCHSEGMAMGERGDLGAAVLNRYLDQLSATTPGVAYLASARENQRSYEDEQWGEGHGAFTWFLLEGMRGAADGWGGRPRDNVVTLDELAAYVSDQVFKETRRRQRPVLGPGRYDPELPLAVTGGLDVGQHLQLARALLEVGWLLDDPAPFLCAAREASAASELAALSGEVIPDAYALTGESLLAAGEAEDALQLLGKAIERHAEKLPAEAWLHLGLAQAELADTGAAAEAMTEFAKRAPKSPDAGWASDYAAWLNRSRRPVTRALVVGVGTYELPGVPQLAGPPNDAALLGDFLHGRLGVAPEHLTILVDSAATKRAIVAALADLAHESRPSDSVVVYFGGHAMPNSAATATYLITHDAPNGAISGISAKDLHTFIASIPARTRLLLLDTHGNAAFNDLVGRDPALTVVAASAPGEMAYEGMVAGRQHGAFTAALVAAWNEVPDPHRITYSELAAGITSRIAQQFPQTPMLLADAHEIVLEGRFPAADLWRLARLRTPSPLAPPTVEACAANSWPRGRRVIARDLTKRKAFAKALRILRAVAKNEGDAPSWIELAKVAVSAGCLDEALAALASIEMLPDADRWHASAKPTADAVRAVREARGRAVLVAVGLHADESLPRVEGAGADLDAIREFLLQHGFSRRDIIELKDEEATSAATLDHLKRLAKHAEDRLGVFYFAGNGSRSAHGEPTIVPYDGRSEDGEDLMLPRLAAIAARAANLVTIIDAACGYDGGGLGTRAAPAAPDVETPRDIALSVGAAPTATPIGAVTMLWEVPAGRQPADAPVREQSAEPGTVRGILTQGLVDAAGGVKAGTLNYANWAEKVRAKTHQVVWAVGPAAGEALLQHRTRRDAMLSELAAVETAPAAAAASLAMQQAVRFQERNEQSPVTHLERGLALAVTGRTDEAIRALKLARNLFDDASVYEEQRRRDPWVDRWHREARLHLGRLLYEHGEGADELNEAVASLRQAHDQAPDDLRITLHLGLAIRALVERQSLVEAAELLRAYLAAGAPLGREGEVRTFLNQLASQPASEGDEAPT
jgi:uncharacterized caspase-like protein